MTVEEVGLLPSLHRGTKDRRFADRIKAVILLGTNWTVAETAEALLLDEDTISKYVQLYRQGGTDLLLKNVVSGPQCQIEYPLRLSSVNRTPENLQIMGKASLKSS